MDKKGETFWEKILLFTGKCVIATLCVTAVVLIGIFASNYWTSDYYVKPWFNPPPEEMAKRIRERSVVTLDGLGRQGSGCELIPGLVVTARHVMGDAILDMMVTNEFNVLVGGKKAEYYKHSITGSDYVFLLTKPKEKIDFNKIEFTKTLPTIGQDVYVSGSPGASDNPHNPAKIIKIEKNQKFGYTDIHLSGQYTDLGLSGGCIYDMEGKFMGILKQKPPGSTHIGFVTIIDGIY